MNKDFAKGLAAAGIVAGLFLTFQSFGATTKTVVLSDEQQGIMAVRTAKASVVSIVGATTANATVTSPSLTPVDTVAGTGFVVSSSGLIVSNDHVVSDPTLTYNVSLIDGTEYPAKILAMDKYDDIAILKIQADGLTPAALGDSGSLETGQTVFAIGNALGQYQDTVTRGVVSGLNRAVEPPSDTSAPTPRLQDMIQTDAAINPGNSGGPLIDMNGDVIGMDTLIDTGGAGLGFAIPINTIKSVVSQLETYGKVEKAYLGVEFETVDPEIKAAENLTVSNGAFVDQVASGSPAAAAGLQAGDVIVAINHQQLTQENELDTVASQYAPGAQILVTYVRNGQQTDAALVLGVLP